MDSSILLYAAIFLVITHILNKLCLKVLKAAVLNKTMLPFINGIRSLTGDNAFGFVFAIMQIVFIALWCAFPFLFSFLFSKYVDANAHRISIGEYEIITNTMLLVNAVAIGFAIHLFLKHINFFREISFKILEFANSRKVRTEFGSAKFEALSPEYKGFGLFSIYLGGGAYLLPDQKKHIITFAPTRSGKGTCLILPNLLYSFLNSYVVLDIKGENAAVSARLQRDLGKDAVIIDPWGVQENIGAKHGITPMAFNPLALLEGMSDEQLFEECTSIAELIAPMPKNIKDPFWINRARVLIRGLLLYHVKTEMPVNWSLLAIYKALRLSDVEFIANIMLGCETPLAADDLNQFKGKSPSEKEFGSILSTAQDATEFIRNVSKGGGVAFNPKQLNQKPTALYICIPERAIETNYRWLRLIIGLSIRAISENIKNKQVERTVFLLDEAHYLGSMPEIRKALATSATYGICIWQFYQDIGQVQAAYGDYWHTIMNVGVQQFFKVSDLNTQKYVSELLGDRTIELTNISTNPKGEQSTSESITGARLVTPEQVGKMTQIITRMDAKTFLLAGTPYYDPVFKFEYDKNPLV
jgi:type IV secretion system protein VirD4